MVTINNDPVQGAVTFDSDTADQHTSMLNLSFKNDTIVCDVYCMYGMK